MKKIILLTKTKWSESPRIRHQIARLFNKKGYEVHFVEKSSYSSFFVKKRKEEGIYFYSHPELIHHQLRYNSLLQLLNNLIVKFYLRRITKGVKFQYVINFNYDYFFLTSIFSTSQIISFINDDFESMAKFGMRKQISKQLKKTCESSNDLITVSYPLHTRLKKFNSKTNILFPWASKHYKRPKINQKRNVVLYFGYIGRLNWSIIEKLINQTNYTYRFIGPCSSNKDKFKLERLVANINRVEYISFSELENLKVDDVFCSLLPYDVDIESNQACTISNRALNLLSLGIPLVYANLKNLIKAPKTIMRKNDNLNEYKKSLEYYYINFDKVQPDIKAFLNNHYEDNRWDQITHILD